MTRRMKLGLILVLALAATPGGGQPPPALPVGLPEQAVPTEPKPEADIQQVQNLEAPTLTRQGRGPWTGTLTSQVGPPPAPTPTAAEVRPSASLPPQPPTPSVQLTVLVPRDHPPGKDVPCTIKATNASGGDAHKVTVRAEIDGADVVPADPKAEAQTAWSFKTLKANDSQTIELKLRPKANAASVSVKAFVSFEHGQAVKTTLSRPKLQVKTEVPKQQAADEPVPVRVTVRNNGRVPVTGAKLTETLNDGFEFHKDVTGGEETKQKKTQRLWAVGTIQPGETKTLQYLVTATRGRKLRILTAVDAAEAGGQADDEAESDLLDAGLKVHLSGDGRVSSEQSAQYEATVTNTGTLPLTNVRVTGSVPDDCRVMKKTNGGKVGRDGVLWTIPKLAPGDAYTFRWSLQADRDGRKEVRAAAVANRGVEDVAKVETVFQGTAVLHCKSVFDRDIVATGQEGVLTVRVNNSGSEAAANVRLAVELPKDLVGFVQASPAYKKDGDKLVFDARTLGAGKAEAYTITFRGADSGRAFFKTQLAADALGDRPINHEKPVVIVRK